MEQNNEISRDKEQNIIHASQKNSVSHEIADILEYFSIFSHLKSDTVKTKVTENFKILKDFGVQQDTPPNTPFDMNHPLFGLLMSNNTKLMDILYIAERLGGIRGVRNLGRIKYSFGVFDEKKIFCKQLFEKCIEHFGEQEIKNIFTYDGIGPTSSDNRHIAYERPRSVKHPTQHMTIHQRIQQSEAIIHFCAQEFSFPSGNTTDGVFSNAAFFLHGMNKPEKTEIYYIGSCTNEIKYMLEEMKVPFERFLQDDWRELVGPLHTIFQHLKHHHKEYLDPYTVPVKELFSRKLIYTYLSENIMPGNIFLKTITKLEKIAENKDIFDMSICNEDIIFLASKELWESITEEKKIAITQKYSNIELNQDTLLPKVLIETLRNTLKDEESGINIHTHNIILKDNSMWNEDRHAATKQIQQYSYTLLEREELLSTFLKERMIPKQLTYTHDLWAFIKDITGKPYQNQKEICKILHNLWPTIINYPYNYQKTIWSFITLLKTQNKYDLLLTSMQHLKKCSKDVRKEYIKTVIPIILEGKETMGGIRDIGEFLQDEISTIIKYKKKGEIQNFTNDFHQRLGGYYKEYLGLQDINRLLEGDEESQVLMKYFIYINKKNNTTNTTKNENFNLGLLLGLSKEKQLASFRGGDQSMLPTIIESTALEKRKEESQNTPSFEFGNDLWDKIQQEKTHEYIASNKQDLSDTISGIQTGFWDLLDPDNYEKNTVWHSIAHDIYTNEDDSNFSNLITRAKTIYFHKVEIVGIPLSEEEFIVQLQEKIPIIRFAEQINQLQIIEILQKISDNPNDSILQEDGKRIIKEAKIIFEGLQKKYEEGKLNNLRLQDIKRYFIETTVSTEDIIENKHYVCITNDMNKIIPSIRGCLACTSKQSNNHKNIEFLYPNRFLILTDSENNNIADQLVMLLPSNKGLLYVVDTLYGLRSKEIITNHIIGILEKIQKENISEKIGVYIPTASVKSSGAGNHTLIKFLKKHIPENYTIEICNDMECEKTCAGYNEFGDAKEGILITTTPLSQTQN